MIVSRGTRVGCKLSRSILARQKLLQQAPGARSTHGGVGRKVVEGGVREEKPETGSVARGYVVEAKMLSPTTRSLRFLLESEPERVLAQMGDQDDGPKPPKTGAFAFRAGQWVDCVIPGCESIGGFSMTTSPSEMPHMELAVKASDHEPSQAAVHKASIGDEWLFRVGGNLCLPEDLGPETHLVFLAGGIGITPLYAMARHLSLCNIVPKKVSFVHSARTEDELIFAEDLRKFADEHGGFDYLPHVTQDRGRLTQDALAEIVGEGDKAKTLCYMCGPPTFASDLKPALEALGVAKGNIHGEKWW